MDPHSNGRPNSPRERRLLPETLPRRNLWPDSLCEGQAHERHRVMHRRPAWAGRQALWGPWTGRGHLAESRLTSQSTEAPEARASLWSLAQLGQQAVSEDGWASSCRRHHIPFVPTTLHP